MSFHSSVSLANDTSGPSAMHSLGGAGLPSTGVTNGPRGQSVGGLLSGTGMDTGFHSMHVGRHTSTMDPVSNPRGTIHTQYFLDTTCMNIEADIGDMEVHYMFVDSGPMGIIGQNRPHRFMTLSRLNYWLKELSQRLLYGPQRDMRWFRKMLSVVGILRHEDTKGRVHAKEGNICQLFSTGFKTKCFDIWQSYENRRENSKSTRGGDIGPEIGDLLQIVWRRYEYKDELEGKFGPNPAGSTAPTFYWQGAPYYSKTNQEAPMLAVQNCGQYPSTGGVDIIGRVGAIYGTAANPRESRAVARKIIWNPSYDGSYKLQLHKLRQLEIEVSCV